MMKTIQFATERALRNAGYEDVRVLKVHDFYILDNDHMTVHAIFGDDDHTDATQVDGEFVVHGTAYLVGSGPRIVAYF